MLQVDLAHVSTNYQIHRFTCKLGFHRHVLNRLQSTYVQMEDTADDHL